METTFFGLPVSPDVGVLIIAAAVVLIVMIIIVFIAKGYAAEVRKIERDIETKRKKGNK